MTLASILVFFLFLWAVDASPLINARDDSCTTDSCLSVVTRNHVGHRYRGCTSFFRETIYPKDVTKTAKVTVTSTSLTTVSPVTTQHSTESITLTRKTTLTKTRIVSITSILTKTVKSTSFDISTSLVTSTEDTTTASSTKSTSTTITTTQTTSVSTAVTTTISTPGNAKRTARLVASTGSVTTVPPYASSACPNTDLYSSACSCVGVKHRRTTASGSTSTTTITLHQVVTETVHRPSTTTDISTDVSTDVLTFLTTQPSTMPFFASTTTSELIVIPSTTVEIIPATRTVSTTAVVTETLTSTFYETTTVTATSTSYMPQQTNYYIQVKPGGGTRYDGQYFSSAVDYPGVTHISLTESQTNATLYTIDSQNRLIDLSNKAISGTTGGGSLNGGAYTIKFASPPRSTVGNCSIAPSSELSCIYGQNNVFWYFPDIGANGLLTTTVSGSALFGGAVPITVNAVISP